jgi:MOSC domain-containing protein YiiM
MAMATVEGIHVAAREAEPVEAVEQVTVLAGRGVEGDRHFGEHAPGSGHDLTLVPAESLEALAEETGIRLAPGESRRQVTTRGIDVHALVGRRFTVGSVEAVGIELCEPCNHLQKLTQPGIVRGLAHRAGINADVVRDGQIAVGDEVVDQGPA